MKSTPSRFYIRRASLVDAVKRVLKPGIELHGASDLGVSEAMYLCDADGKSNGHGVTTAASPCSRNH